jgi:cobalt-zinc-cadmium efflux system protein
MNDHSHSHKKDSFSELFEFRNVARKRLIIALIITLVVMIFEIVGGLLTGSIALLSEAGHIFTHGFAIGISLIAMIIARKPPTHRRTYGLYRAEVLAAFINGLVLLFIVGVILYEAIERLINPSEINAIQMFGIAIIGLVVNIINILLLRSNYRTNLSIKSVFYHLIGDIASAIGIVIGAIIIFYTNWNIVDPIISIGISALILFWAINILRESSIILLEMAPRGMELDKIEEDIKKRFPEVKKIEKAHLWSITSDMMVFSAHMAISCKEKNVDKCGQIIFPEISKYLRDKYNIIETTIQHL